MARTQRDATRRGGRLPIDDCRILVVDDTDFNRALIGAMLAEGGFRNLAFARDGSDALAQIGRHMPDLVLLDLMMPGMDGFEVCRRLRADHPGTDLPVLVQTALTGTDDRNRAFADGATDFVSKPLDRAELLARVRIHLENRVLIRDLQLYRGRVEGELDMLRSMVEYLLPGPALCARLAADCRVALRSHTVLSSALGGDLWGVEVLPSRRIGVFLLDMAGRGISAALNALRMHTLIRELLARDSVDAAPGQPAPLGEDPAGLLTALNAGAAGLLERGDYATMIYGVYDPVGGRFTYAAAAATSPLVLPAEGGAVQVGDAAGLPLGAAPATGYDARVLDVPAGAALVLYSNAVLDALEEAGRAGDMAALAADAIASEAAVAARFDRLTAAVAAALGADPGDDHTLVWLSRLPG